MRLLVAPVASVAFSRKKVGNASDALPKDGSRLAATEFLFATFRYNSASFRVTIVPHARGRSSCRKLSARSWTTCSTRTWTEWIYQEKPDLKKRLVPRARGGGGVSFRAISRQMTCSTRTRRWRGLLFVARNGRHLFHAHAAVAAVVWAII